MRSSMDIDLRFGTNAFAELCKNAPAIRYAHN